MAGAPLAAATGRIKDRRHRGTGWAAAIESDGRSILADGSRDHLGTRRRPWIAGIVADGLFGEGDGAGDRVLAAEDGAGGVQAVDDQQDPLGHAGGVAQPGPGGEI